jgi:DNA repair protein RecO (recombination protein O)
LGDSDLIAMVYTRGYGRLSGVARNAYRTRSQFMGKLEPLSWSEIVFFAKEGRELVSIDKVDLIQSFGQRTGSYRCLMQLNLVAELVAETTPEREPNDSLFRLLLLALPLLTQAATADLAQLYFEVWYLRLAGLFPDHRSCWHCGRLLPPDQACFIASTLSFSCLDCVRDRAREVSAEGVRLLSAIFKQHLKDLSRQLPQPAAMEELGRYVEELLQRNFERSFHSLKLIQDAI